MSVKRKSLKGFDKQSIIEHLQDVAKELGKDTLSTRDLKKYGDISSSTRRPNEKIHDSHNTFILSVLCHIQANG